VLVRCAGCGSTTNLPVGEVDGEFTCPSCGRRNTVTASRALGATPVERTRRTFQYALLHRIDVVTAYLVLLGILPLEAAQSVHAEEPEDGPVPSPNQLPAFEPTEGTAAATGKITPIDPGFCAAIENGWLTFQEAVARGDRVAYAAGLSRTHDLSLDVSFMVADNFLQLDEALANKADADAKAAAAAAAKRRARSLKRVAFGDAGPIAAGLALGALCGWTIWMATAARDPALRTEPAHARSHRTARGGVAAVMGREPVPAEKPQRPKVDFVVDRSGALTQVSGPDPTSVLEAFCSHPWTHSRFALQSIAPGVVPSPAERVGVLMDRDRGDTVTVIVSRVSRTRRWQIGSGIAPITLVEQRSAKTETAG